MIPTEYVWAMSGAALLSSDYAKQIDQRLSDVRPVLPLEIFAKRTGQTGVFHKHHEACKRRGRTGAFLQQSKCVQDIRTERCVLADNYVRITGQDK